MRAAVQELSEVSGGESDPARTAAALVIDALLDTSRLLTETPLVGFDGVALHPEQQPRVDRALARRERSLEQGDSARVAGEPNGALNRYRKAWEHAKYTLNEAAATP
jgi:hypothetical protein